MRYLTLLGACCIKKEIREAFVKNPKKTATIFAFPLSDEDESAINQLSFDAESRKRLLQAFEDIEEIIKCDDWPCPKPLQMKSKRSRK